MVIITNIKWYLYRLAMRIAHRFNWHYAPPIHPEGDTLIWCKWCGLRYVAERAKHYPLVTNDGPKDSRCI